MPVDFTLLQFIVFALCVLITGVSKSGFAGGLGVVTVPLLSLVMSPLVAVSLMLPTLIVMDVMSLRVWWGKQDTPSLKMLIPSGIVGVIIGYLTFSMVNEAQIKLLLGIVSILFALNGLTGLFRMKSCDNKLGILFGGLGGFTSFVAHAGGPPLNLYLLSKQFTKQVYLSTAVVFFAAINLAKVPPYIALGQFTQENVVTALLFIPLSFIGIKLGVFAQHHLDERKFFAIIYVLLMVLGISLVVG